MTKELLKTKLVELGYLDNEYLDKYIELVFVNLNTKKTRSSQAHHVIPVIDYWNSDEPYDRQAALKLTRQDATNTVINLLYKDHLLAHAYLTLCSDLVSLQRHYDAQARIKPHSKSINEIIQANYAIMSLAELG